MALGFTFNSFQANTVINSNVMFLSLCATFDDGAGHVSACGGDVWDDAANTSLTQLANTFCGTPETLHSTDFQGTFIPGFYAHGVGDWPVEVYLSFGIFGGKTDHTTTGVGPHNTVISILPTPPVTKTLSAALTPSGSITLQPFINYHETVQGTITPSGQVHLIPGRRVSGLVAPSSNAVLFVGRTPDAIEGDLYQGFARAISIPQDDLPWVYAVISGALPDGVSLNPLTGALTGIPTKRGTYTFAIRATRTG